MSNDPKLWTVECIITRDISTEFKKKKIVESLRRERIYSKHISGRGGKKYLCQIVEYFDITLRIYVKSCQPSLFYSLRYKPHSDIIFNKDISLKNSRIHCTMQNMVLGLIL